MKLEQYADQREAQAKRDLASSSVPRVVPARVQPSPEEDGGKGATEPVVEPEPEGGAGADPSAASATDVQLPAKDAPVHASEREAGNGSTDGEPVGAEKAAKDALQLSAGSAPADSAASTAQLPFGAAGSAGAPRSSDGLGGSSPTPPPAKVDEIVDADPAEEAPADEEEDAGHTPPSSGGPGDPSSTSSPAGEGVIAGARGPSSTSSPAGEDEIAGEEGAHPVEEKPAPTDKSADTPPPSDTAALSSSARGGVGGSSSTSPRAEEDAGPTKETIVTAVGRAEGRHRYTRSTSLANVASKDLVEALQKEDKGSWSPCPPFEERRRFRKPRAVLVSTAEALQEAQGKLAAAREEARSDALMP